MNIEVAILICPGSMRKYMHFERFVVIIYDQNVLLRLWANQIA